jgi:type IV pilus assembly protein PilN
MIRINLIPFRAARKKENIRKQVSIFMLSFVFVMVALVWYNFSLGAKISELDAQIKTTKKQKAAYQEINEEIREIQTKLALLDSKTAVIEKLEQNRREPILLLDTMTSLLVPNRLWFTSFSAREKALKPKAEETPKGQKGKKAQKSKQAKTQQAEEKLETVAEVEIKGIAMDNKTVADFMTSLEKSGLFSAVNLKSIKKINIREVDVKEFELTCTRKSPEKLEPNKDINLKKGDSKV